jgi:hypothetical protein
VIQPLEVLTLGGGLITQSSFQSATTMVLYAPLIQIVYQSSDLLTTTTTSTPKSTTAGKTATSKSTTLKETATTSSSLLYLTFLPPNSYSTKPPNYGLWWLSLVIGIPCLIIVFCIGGLVIRRRKKHKQKNRPMPLPSLPIGTIVPQNTQQNSNSSAKEWYWPTVRSELMADGSGQRPATNPVAELQG